MIAAFIQWEPECLKRLRGMFSFGVLDLNPPEGGAKQTLARDRFGIKPLRYVDQHTDFRFASELSALGQASSRRVDRDAILDYLADGSVFQPGPFMAVYKPCRQDTRLTSAAIEFHPRLPR